MKQPHLRIRHVSKAFDGVTVVDDVSLEIAAGEILGLVGPNGCGKSTIIKILSGFHRPEPGAEIRVGGHLLAPDSPRREAGMAFVHQDLALVAGASVVENLALGVGFRIGLLWRIDWSAERKRAEELLATFGIRAEADTRIADMSPADVTLVAITRALSSLPHNRASLLVLDEPTSSLTDTEVRRVLHAIRQVAAEGSAVLFVSHRLDEVLDVAHRVNVMRDGQIVADRPTAGLTERDVVELMLGRPLERMVPEPESVSPDAPLIEVRGLAGGRLQPIDIAVRPGEIVGVTGLLGSGKTELGRLLAGASPLSAGEILVAGRPCAFRSPADAIRAGISYVPPERRTQGGIPAFLARENITLPGLSSFWSGWRLDSHRERTDAADWMGRTQVVPLDTERSFVTFSGGNQQKLVFAKWFRMNPKILVLDEPTQGVDVGAVRELYQLIQHAAADGRAVLLLSSEWDDLARICHRVIVLNRGRRSGELSGRDLTSDNIAALSFAGAASA
jgi:ribose transport system ATP-binding protein